MNILSLDGGGVRGIISLTILKEIMCRACQKSNKELYVADLFDFFSGSSIGTVIISALLLPDSQNNNRPKYTIDIIIDKLKEEMPKLFSVSYIDNIRTLWGFRLPKYINDHRNDFFSNIFENTTFGQLLKPVMFPCGDSISQKPVYFSNQDTIHKNLNICEILMGTTAAPTYFASKEITINGNKMNLIDSGCVTNNTGTLAFTFATKMYKNEIRMDDIYAVSIGTGQVENSYQSQWWGAIQWLPVIIGSLMDLNCQNQEYELSLIASTCQYDRLNPTIPINLDYLDQSQYIPEYIKITEQWISNNGEKLDLVVDKLLKNKTTSHKN